MIKPKKPPYSDTEKDPESTILDINRMLRLYGIDNYQWTTLWEKNVVELRLVLEDDEGRKIPIKILPPMFVAKRRTYNSKIGKYEKVEAPNWAQGLRLMFWWLKLKIEAIAYGLREVKQEFLGDIVVHDRNGRERTVTEIVVPAIEEGRLDLQALGPKPEDEEAKA